MIVLYVLGVATAIYVTNDPNWSRWHISYLGEHPGLGADIFNYGVMFGGAIMVWFALLRMHAYLTSISDARRCIAHSGDGHLAHPLADRDRGV